MEKHRIAGAVCIVTLFTALAFAGIPQTINYQGYLKNTATGAPASGTVSMTFSLYSSATPRNNPLWRETKDVSPVNGIYSTQLGSTTPITAPFDVPYYLGVKAGSDAEMALQPLSSVPYALKAASVADNSITTASLSINCGDGQVLVKTLTGWQCGLVCSCPLDQQNCGGSCANLLTDRNHCGSCGTLCAAGQICSGGSCVLSCQAGLTTCGSACVNLASDQVNCGACGTACPSGNICTAGTCVTSCPSGFANCGGVCRDLYADTNN